MPAPAPPVASSSSSPPRLTLGSDLTETISTEMKGIDASVLGECEREHHLPPPPGIPPCGTPGSCTKGIDTSVMDSLSVVNLS